MVLKWRISEDYHVQVIRMAIDTEAELEAKTNTDHGYANSWRNTPKQVEQCKHTRKVETIGNCLTKYSCAECGFSYIADSGD